MPTIRTMLVVCIPALFILCQVGRVRRGNTRFPTASRLWAFENVG